MNGEDGGEGGAECGGEETEGRNAVKGYGAGE